MAVAWFTDDGRGVSKVVGVVLLVAIVVLLAAMVGVVTTGIGGETPTQAEIDAGQASFSFDYADNETWDPASHTAGEWQLSNPAFIADVLTITYEGSPPLDSDNLYVQMTGKGTGFKCITEANELGCGATHDSRETLAHVGADTEITAGDSVRITTIVDDVYGSGGRPVSAEMNEASVEIIWISDSGETSLVVAEWQPRSAS